MQDPARARYGLGDTQLRAIILYWVIKVAGSWFLDFVSDLVSDVFLLCVLICTVVGRGPNYTDCMGWVWLVSLSQTLSVGKGLVDYDIPMGFHSRHCG